MHTEGIIYSSMAVLLITGMFMNLMDIAQTTADTTLTFATDMNLALDCATRGVSIFECSPNLDPEPFVKQLKETQKFLQNQTIELNSSLTNITTPY